LYGESYNTRNIKFYGVDRMNSHEERQKMYISCPQRIPSLLTIRIDAPSVFTTTEHVLGANLLETLFVLSFNHQNSQLGLIALTQRRCRRQARSARNVEEEGCSQDYLEGIEEAASQR
jgi:hypothetical protein